MKNSQQTKVGSTQKFTEIQDIIDDIVLLTNGNACTIIEVQASNFALLSDDEQQSKLIAYANLINSLSFPIQILIRNRPVDLSSYIRLLDDEEKKQLTQSPSNFQQKGIASPIGLYKEFIRQLISVNTVLDKKFYIIISYSYLESGTTATASFVKGNDKNLFLTAAKASLQTKSVSLHSQLARLSLRAETLTKEALVKLFYDIYNPAMEGQGTVDQVMLNTNTPIIQLQK